MKSILNVVVVFLAISDKDKFKNASQKERRKLSKSTNRIAGRLLLSRAYFLF